VGRGGDDEDDGEGVARRTDADGTSGLRRVVADRAPLLVAVDRLHRRTGDVLVQGPERSAHDGAAKAHKLFVEDGDVWQLGKTEEERSER